MELRGVCEMIRPDAHVERSFEDRNKLAFVLTIGEALETVLALEAAIGRISAMCDNAKSRGQNEDTQRDLSFKLATRRDTLIRARAKFAALIP